jgi:hypothetical protein
MSVWWTYRLSSFLMFSPAIYWRLVERYNREVWPLQLLMLAVGAALLWLVAVRLPMAGRVVAGALAAAWLWVGWAFHWQRYATINWAAEYFAAAYALQALLLLVFAIFGTKDAAQSRSSGGRAIGLALAMIGVLAYPFFGVAQGRAWTQVFGVMPEPTALATLGLLLATRLPRRGWLMIIPVLSLLIGLATWWLLRG